MGKESGGCDVGSFPRLLSRILFPPLILPVPNPPAILFSHEAIAGLTWLVREKSCKMEEGRKEGKERERKRTCLAALSQVMKQ